VVLIVLALLAMNGCSTYNAFVSKEVEVEKSWGQVQSAYQRRADLIPNLVNTVKGVANFEQETLTKVVEARAKATQMTIDPTKATPEQLKEFQSAQGELSQALGKLLVITENYPELKANQSFLELQSQLEGTENRIKVDRDKFNEAVADYNVSVRKFPASFYASIFGFSTKPQFEAEAGAQDAPKVEF
jgi:LemA protein